MAQYDDNESAFRAKPSRFGPTGAAKRIAKLGKSVGSAAAHGIATEYSDTEPRLLFILSTERSGSTLLSMALGANPRHISPPEMHLLAYPTFAEWRREYPSALLSLKFRLRTADRDDSDAAIDRRFAGWQSADVYRWILSDLLESDKIVIDKTPKYSRSLDVLQRIETLRPRYIWLVRHPLAVAASQLALRRDRRRVTSSELLDVVKSPLRSLREKINRRSSLRQEIDYWKAVHSNIEHFLSRISLDRWRRASFERLVREPEIVLRELCDWLGTEFRPEMLEPAEHVPGEMRPDLGDPKIYHRQRIDASAADEWRGEYHDDYAILDAADRLLIRRWGVGS